MYKILNSYKEFNLLNQLKSSQYLVDNYNYSSECNLTNTGFVCTSNKHYISNRPAVSGTPVSWAGRRHRGDGMASEQHRREGSLVPPSGSPGQLYRL